METFQECGVQMLREFRALLQHSPLPVNQTRLLQLLALNMFAVANTQLKGRSALGQPLSLRSRIRLKLGNTTSNSVKPARKVVGRPHSMKEA